MPLTWDATACPTWVLSTDQWPVTECLIFTSMVLGYGSITEANAADVYAGISVYESLCGPLLTDDGQPYRIKPADVAARIGLRTNAVNGKTVRANVLRVARERLAESRAAYLRAIEETT